MPSNNTRIIHALRTLAATALLAASPACDSGAPAKDDAKKVATNKPEAKPDAAPVVEPEKPEDKAPVAVDPADSKIELAAAVAREISSAPEKADEILGKHGLDRQKLDALMFEIAGDPALTKRYMDARTAT